MHACENLVFYSINGHELIVVWLKVCNKRYSNAAGLHWHRRTQHLTVNDEVPLRFPCSECGQTYGSLRYLKVWYRFSHQYHQRSCFSKVRVDRKVQLRCYCWSSRPNGWFFYVNKNENNNLSNTEAKLKLELELELNNKSKWKSHYCLRGVLFSVIVWLISAG